jgi:hypothetical protein
MIKSSSFIVLAFATFASFFSHAQNDFGAWTGVDISAKLNNDTKFGLEVQSRFSRNLTKTDEVFFSPFVKYDVNKLIRVGADYRYTNLIGKVNDAHRICFDIEARNLVDLIKDGSRFNMSFRTRFTHEYQKTKRNDDYFRCKFDFEYNLPKSKLKPEVGAELFYHFADQISYTFTSVTSRSRINKFRLKAGLSYPITKNQDLSVFYMIQSRTQESKTDYILGIGYSYDIGKLKKKKGTD